MKKLLLLIVPLLLFFGVSFADTFTFSNTYTYSNLDVMNGAWDVFEILWHSWNTINLYSINTPYGRPFSCWYWDLNEFVGYWNWGTITTLKQWAFASQSWETATIIDYDLEPWKLYSIIFHLSESSYNYCSLPRSNSSAYWYYSWFLNVLYGTWERANLHPNSSSYRDWVFTYVFSWTDPRITTAPPTTIHYNWTTIQTTDPDIRINGFFNSYTLSGSSLVFNFQPYYRVFFRHDL